MYLEVRHPEPRHTGRCQHRLTEAECQRFAALFEFKFKVGMDDARPAGCMADISMQGFYYNRAHTGIQCSVFVMCYCAQGM